ncbi:unnamed protein product [Prunus armeniaca]|uniref:Uncharacterized protein n=1 Tax=Prunus armeniaca TaxID=36596 RepID=A0A6J5TLB5_PRUAR|nr:unnamed protein product [Prunus armeniaca]
MVPSSESSPISIQSKSHLVFGAISRDYQNNPFAGISWEVGPKLEELCGLARREKEAGIFSEPEVDIFMKATSMGGVESSLITDYTLRGRIFMNIKVIDKIKCYWGIQEDCKLRDLVVKDGME